MSLALGTVTGIASRVAGKIGIKLPKLNLFGDNAKKEAKDKIKASMKELGVKESAIQGFSWRNARAGKELLEFLYDNYPDAIQAYNSNPIGDIGGDTVKEWKSWFKQNYSVSPRASSNPPKMQSTSTMPSAQSGTDLVVVAAIVIASAVGLGFLVKRLK